MRENYLLGKWFSVDYKLVRTYVEGDRREWQKVSLPEYKIVLITGVRTLSDGEVIYETDDDCGYITKIFVPDHYFKALLVVTGARNKPFPVYYEAY